jgi:predicted small metal-binding protein
MGTKMLKCRDVGVNCDEVIRGNSEAEILQKAAAHAQGCHQGVKMTPELQTKLKAAIKDEPQSGSSSCCGGSSCG